MMRIQLPYGRETIPCNLPEERVKAVITSGLHSYDPGRTEAELVAQAMAEPIGSPRLEELAKGKQNVVKIGRAHV